MLLLDRVARGLGRLEVGARRRGARPHAPEQIELVGDVERGAMVAVLARNTREGGRGARRHLLAAHADLRVDGREEERVRLAEDAARLVDASDRDRFIERLPVRPEAGDFAAVILATLLLCLAAAIYPAWRASRLDPVDAIRRQG